LPIYFTGRGDKGRKEEGPERGRGKAEKGRSFAQEYF